MSYNTKKPTRAIIPTPAEATEELHREVVESAITHFTPVLTPTLLIGSRKSCYAVVINSTYDNKPLDQLLGSDNAKHATEQILAGLTLAISTIPHTTA